MDKRNLIQKRAAESWWSKGGKGTLNMHTGFGKNFTAFEATRKLSEDSRVLFLYEVTNRKKDVLAEMQKYREIKGYDVAKNYKWFFKTYQGARTTSNEKWDLVIADEIHFAMTPEYSRFFYNNHIKHVLGLSATVDDNVIYEEIGNKSKQDLLREIAPVVFKYSLTDGRKNNTSRKLNIFVVDHELDNKYSTIPAGNKRNRFNVTEYQNYQYLTKSYEEAFNIRNQASSRMFARKRSELLYKLPSKKKTLEVILSIVEGRSILFGNNLDTLLDITPNIVCSRYKPEQNDKIRENFENGEIDLIGSFHKLKQGANLGNVDNVINHSYYSKVGDIEQRAGRCRKDGDKLANLIIVRTKETREVEYVKGFLASFPKEHYNIIMCRDASDFAIKYMNRETREL